MNIFKKIVLRIAITCFTSLLVFIVFEVALRQIKTHIVNQEVILTKDVLESDPRLLYKYGSEGRRLLPNKKVVINNHYLSGKDISIETNSLGFRDDELKAVKSKNEYRILLLGDSITISEGLAREKTFSEIAEKELDKDYPGRDIEIINAGVGDIGTREELAILKEAGLKAQPDKVVLAFYLNDSRPSWGFQEEAGHYSWLRRNSVTIDTIVHGFKMQKWLKDEGADRLAWVPAQKELDWLNERDDFLKLANLARYDWGVAWEDSSWAEIRKYFIELKELSAEDNFKVSVLAFPVQFQVQASFLENRPQQKLEQISKEQGFGYFDLLPTLRANSNQNLFFDQCHLTEKGSQIIGNSLARYLASQIDRE